MAPNPFFSGRIPQELNQQIEEFCKSTGKSKTEFMREAFYKYLDLPTPTSERSPEVTKEMYQTLLRRVENLEAKNGSKESIDYKDSTKENSCDNSIITNDNGNIYEIEISKENELINSQELIKIAKITAPEANNLKSQVFRKAKKGGYQIDESTEFNPPIKMVFKKGITIDSKKYKLFCKRLDKDKNPLWKLIKDENDSYQTVITEMEKSV